MISPLMFKGFNGFSFINYQIGCTCQNTCPVAAYLTFGKIGENPVVTPTTSTQVVYPSGVNKFLESVTVNPIPTTPGA